MIQPKMNFSLQLTPAQDRKLRRIAAAREQPRSEVVRALLDQAPEPVSGGVVTTTATEQVA